MEMAVIGPACSWRRSGSRWPWLGAATGWLILLAGCGLAANPQPPTLWLPAPVKDLTAGRSGGEVELHWTMPKNTTDKVALKGDQRAHFCWETPAAGSEILSVRARTAGPPKAAGKRPAT